MVTWTRSETFTTWFGVTVVVPESDPVKLICFAFSNALAPGAPNLNVAVVVPGVIWTDRETSVDSVGHESKKFPLPSLQPRKFTFTLPLRLNGLTTVRKTSAESALSAAPNLKLNSVGLGLTC